VRHRTHQRPRWWWNREVGVGRRARDAEGRNQPTWQYPVGSSNYEASCVSLCIWRLLFVLSVS
jgi:hypothetical protein